MLRLHIEEEAVRAPRLMVPAPAQLVRGVAAPVNGHQGVAHAGGRDVRPERPVLVLDADAHGAVVEFLVRPGAELVELVGRGVKVLGEGADVHGVDEAFAVEAAVVGEVFAGRGDGADEEEGEEAEEGGGGEEIHFVERGRVEGEVKGRGEDGGELWGVVSELWL